MGYTFDWNVVWDNLGLLISGAGTTLYLSAIAIAGALVLGIAVVPLRTAKLAPVRWLAGAYIETFRTVPLLVQLYIVYFALPELGIRLDSTQAGLVSLVLYSGAYCTEIFRAGIESIPNGQLLAGQSIGLSRWQIFSKIVLPQAARCVIAPLGNQFIETVIGSSIISVIGGVELLQQGTQLESRTYRPFEVFAAVAVIYLVVSQALVHLFALLDRLVGVRRRVYHLADGSLDTPTVLLTSPDVPSIRGNGLEQGGVTDG